MRRSTSRPVVDLPQPLSPTSASVSPAATVKLTPSTALTVAVTRPRRLRRGDEMLDEAIDFEERRAHVRCSARGARQHAAHCPDATSLKGGSSLRHCATAKGQRGWKRQPLGIVCALRHGAGDRGEARRGVVEARDGAEQADRVGVLRRGKERSDRGALDDLAGIHHDDLVARARR